MVKPTKKNLDFWRNMCMFHMMRRHSLGPSFEMLAYYAMGMYSSLLSEREENHDDEDDEEDEEERDYDDHSSMSSLTDDIGSPPESNDVVASENPTERGRKRREMSEPSLSFNVDGSEKKKRKNEKALLKQTEKRDWQIEMHLRAKEIARRIELKKIRIAQEKEKLKENKVRKAKAKK